MPRYRWLGPGPHITGDGEVYRPLEIHEFDKEPDFGPFELVEDEEASEPETPPAPPASPPSPQAEPVRAVVPEPATAPPATQGA